MATELTLDKNAVGWLLATHQAQVNGFHRVHIERKSNWKSRCVALHQSLWTCSTVFASSGPPLVISCHHRIVSHYSTLTKMFLETSWVELETSHSIIDNI